jgi:penicillin-binding protein 1A
MSESTAYLINDILHDVLKNTSYDLKHTFLSTKTGQSNYDYATRVKYNIPQSSTKDSWVISYTPDLTIGIWCGYDNMEGYLTPTTKNIPLKTMKMFLNEFAEENLKYELPKELKLQSVDVINGLLYEVSGFNYNIKRDYFYNGFVPLSKENLDYQIV